MYTKKEPVTVEKEVFYADDGRRFDDKSACENYEKRKNGTRMTLDDLKKMSLNDMREAANKLTDEELDALREEASALYPFEIKTYQEYRDEHKDPKYADGKDECFVGGCKQPAYYEGGDARYWCGMCEEHAGIRYRYVFGLIYREDSIRRKIKFNLGGNQCQNSTK